MGVVVGRHLQRDALVQSVGGDPVQVGARHLQDRHAGIGCEPYRFGEPLVGLGAQRDVQRGRGNPRAQAFQHRVAAQHDLGRRRVCAFRWPAPLGCGLAARLAAGWFGRMCAGRGGAAALQPAPPHPAGADRGPLLGAGFADRAAARRVAGHLLARPVQQRPLRAVGGVGDLDAGLLQPVADLVGQRPVRCARGPARVAAARRAPARRPRPAPPTSRRATPSARRAGRSRECPSSPGSHRAWAIAVSWSPASSARLPSARCACTSASAIGTERSSSRAAANAGVHSPGSTAPTRVRTRCRKSSIPA